MAFTGSQYLQFVRQSLARIAAGGNIKVVAFEETFESTRWKRPEKPSPYSETAAPFPHFDLVEIGFNLHVPKRVQAHSLIQALRSQKRSARTLSSRSRTVGSFRMRWLADELC